MAKGTKAVLPMSTEQARKASQAVSRLLAQPKTAPWTLTQTMAGLRILRRALSRAQFHCI